MSKTWIYKFGGASVKDSSAVKNLAEILRNRLRKNMIIVVSAMGKTTNALESILSEKLNGVDFSKNSAILRSFHLEICEALFPTGHSIFAQVENLFFQLENQLQKPLSQENYDEYYDQVVGFGELLSSKIVAEYLCSLDMIVLWQDAREVIETDSDFRFAKINWEKTRKSCQNTWKPILESFPILTQGFIGRDPKGRTTTLGREGSDFTAAILGTSLDAGSVTIWKDVPGVLNADPKIFSQTQKFDELGYREAAEMTYFGASVIHPKTIKPLANASIPLYVKSFMDPDSPGTKIHEKAPTHGIPTFVLKKDQILVSFKVTDFTFIEEKHIHEIYEQLRSLKLRVNMLQLSAISVSLVIDHQLFKLEQLLKKLKGDFEIRYNEGLELLTILHPKAEEIPVLQEGYEILLEQSTRNTYQVVRRKN
ncbi:aspartate kinase [Algoriphagus mannitolivorans]|uniref:aspartate kinase n=1 Tax=Algoriphagus mannitolivorans TaxID=226504 RepID=UPI00040BCD7F|nr:aspartate kinase [Algoriphagus mannitolivorans]